jgi:hypothetical protein
MNDSKNILNKTEFSLGYETLKNFKFYYPYSNSDKILFYLRKFQI